MTEELQDYFESIIKGFIKVSWDILSGEMKDKKKNNMKVLSEDLKKIARLLKKAGEKLKDKEIPKEEVLRLEIVISYAEKIAAPFKNKYPKLAEIFENLLPYIASQMQLADYVIDGKIRGDMQLSDNKKNIKLHLTPDNQLDMVVKKIKNVVSVIDEHSLKFEQLST